MMNKLAIFSLLAIGLLIFGCTQSPQQGAAPSAPSSAAPAIPSTPSKVSPSANSNLGIPSDITEDAGLGDAQSALDDASAIPPTAEYSLHVKFGKILLDGQGMTLYMFTKDANGTSACYGTCAAIWPPLTITGKPEAEADVLAHLGTTKRTGGSAQVTYDGKPLYYYAKDQKVGDALGQGVNDAWFVVSG